MPRALVAQRIEQKTSNLLVAGSIPTEGAFPGSASELVLHFVSGSGYGSHVTEKIRGNYAKSRPFRVGNDWAISFPEGWVDPEIDVKLVRNAITGEVILSQDVDEGGGSFFDFLRGAPFLPDAALDELAQRGDPPRGASQV